MTDFDALIKSAKVVARRLEDDGSIPNNPSLPLLVYRQAVTLPEDDPATVFEALFTAHGWPAAWRNGIYPFHHFHSTAHEALGVYAGTATARFGGEGGIDMTVSAGDVVIIPAGVGHKAIEASATSASSARTRPGPAPISAGAPRENGPRASMRSRGSRCRRAIPSTAPKAPSPTLVLSRRPRPNAAPPPRARGRVATRRLGRRYSGISLTDTQRRSASDRMVASQ